MIVYAEWSRWQIICYKLCIALIGLIAFYIGFEYMNGAYKISEGYFVEMETTLKDLSLLFVFGIVELMFELFKKVSQFDQTDSLKFVYAFADRNELAEEEIAEAQMDSLRQAAL